MEAAGLPPRGSPSTSTLGLPPASAPLQSRNPFRRQLTGEEEPFDCPICCCDYPPEEFDSATFALSCGHRFCKMCWKEYITGKVKGEGESASIQCMENGCNRVVREEVVDAVVEPAVSAR